MTTQTEAKKEAIEEVLILVLCAGIASDQGFVMAPDGASPEFVNFKPGEPTALKKVYADYLISQDPEKFTVAPSLKKAKDEETEEEKEAKAKKATEAKAAKAAKKKAAKDAAKAAKA